MRTDAGRGKLWNVIVASGPLLALFGFLLTFIQTVLPEENRKALHSFFVLVRQWELPYVFFFAGLTLLVIRRLYESRPLSPLKTDALLIGDDQICGRDLDFQSITADYLQSNDLLFLIGKTGVGKTWFAQKVMVQRLKDDPLYIPIYLNLRVSEWSRVPLELLANRLRNQGVDSSADLPDCSPKEVLSVIQSIRNQTGRTPLIICDQFDDYWHTHRESFHSKRRPLKSADLAARNVFWNTISRALEARLIKCVIVAHDSFTALDSVRFGDYAVYTLHGLDSHATAQIVGQVLQKASANAAQSAGELMALRDAMTSDLLEHNHGMALPIEISVVLRSLVCLPELTVGEYVALDRLAGLERHWIAGEVNRAGSHLDSTMLTRALLLLVDVDDKRLHSRSTEELAAVLGLTENDTRRLAMGLAQLELAQILRVTHDPNLAHPTWDLDHEYLIEAVLNLDSSRNRFDRELAKRSKQYETARSRRERSSALLDWIELWQVMRSIAWKRLSFRRHRRLIVMSLRRRVLHPIPILTVTVCVIAGFIAVNYFRAEENARALLIASKMIGPDAEMRANAAWLLMVEKPVIQGKVLLALTNAPLMSSASGILRAIRGIDLDNRVIVDSVIQQNCYDAAYQSSNHFIRCLALIVESGASGTKALPFVLGAKSVEDRIGAVRALSRFEEADTLRRHPEVRSTMTRWLQDALSARTNQEATVLNNAGCYLARDAAADEARNILKLVLSSTNRKDPTVAFAILAVVEMLPIQFDPVQEASAIELARTAARSTQLSPGPVWMNLPTLWKRLPAERRKAVADTLLGEATKAADTVQAGNLEALAVGFMGPEDESGPILTRIVTSCRNEVLRGNPQRCAQRMPLLGRLKGAMDERQSEQLLGLAKVIIEASNFDDQGWQRFNFFALMSGQAGERTESNSPLNGIGRLLSRQYQRALPDLVIKTALGRRSDPAALGRLVRLGGESVLRHGDPQTVSQWCKMVDERLLISASAAERSSLLIGLRHCAIVEPRWVWNLVSIHYPKQKQLVRKWLEGGPNYERQNWITGLNILSDALPPDQALTEFREWRQLALSRAIPDCGVLMGFGQIRPISELVEPFRWPVCSDDDLGNLAVSVGKHANTSFYRITENVFNLSLNDLARWAKQSGAQVNALPAVPEPARARVIQALSIPRK